MLLSVQNFLCIFFFLDCLSCLFVFNLFFPYLELSILCLVTLTCFKRTLTKVKVALFRYTILLILINVNSHVIMPHQDTEYFHHPQMLPHDPFVVSSLVNVSPSPSATTGLFLVPIILPIPKCHLKGIIKHVIFLVWLLSYNIIYLGLMHIVACISSLFCFIVE